jgi:hypothetical protein
MAEHDEREGVGARRNPAAAIADRLLADGADRFQPTRR